MTAQQDQRIRLIQKKLGEIADCDPFADVELQVDAIEQEVEKLVVILKERA